MVGQLAHSRTRDRKGHDRARKTEHDGVKRERKEEKRKPTSENEDARWRTGESSRGPYYWLPRTSGIPDHYSMGLPCRGGWLVLGTKARLISLHLRNVVIYWSTWWSTDGHFASWVAHIFFLSIVFNIATRVNLLLRSFSQREKAYCFNARAFADESNFLIKNNNCIFSRIYAKPLTLCVKLSSFTWSLFKALLTLSKLLVVWKVVL